MTALPAAATAAAHAPTTLAGAASVVRRAIEHDRVMHRDLRLEHKLGKHVSHRRLARMRTESVSDLRRLEHRLRRERRAQKENTSTASPVLQAIAACESGGNPQAVGGGGTFRGKYQFSYSTWASVGGTGDPAAAPVAEQDRRAAILYARTGPASWPVCGR
jgi:hypothetical protein